MNKSKEQDILLMTFPKVNKNYFIVLILILTSIAFLPALQNGFVRWDDQVYVTNSEIIKSLARGEWGPLGSNVAGNFHPLTMFSLSMDYLMFKLDPFFYHLKNLIFHLLNTLLVFYLMMHVTKKNFFVACLTALLFGIHPMHIESVAWVSERKDVLYSFYFLLGLNAYYVYNQSQNKAFYFFTLIAFLLSCLAKSAAVVFPLVMVLIDYVQDKKLVKKKIFEKIPFFAISLIFGIVALYTQSEAGAIDLEKHSFLETLLYSSLGFATYIIKFFFPYQLAHTHPTPELNNFLLGAILLLNLVILFLIFKFRNRFSWLFWGYGFFIITIILVLQIIQIGSSFISDRYTYMPYVGLGLIYATTFEIIYKKYASLKPLLWLGLAAHFLFLGYKTFSHTAVWKDTVTLWNNYMKVYPNQKSKGYTNLAEYYAFNGDSLRAFQLIDTAILIDPENYRAYEVKGNFYFIKGEYDLTKKYLDKTLAIKPEYIKAYKPRSLINFEKGEYEEALKDIKVFLDKVKNDYEAFNLRGNIYLKLNKPDSALLDFNQTLSLEENFVEARNNKNMLEGRMKAAVNPTGKTDMNAIEALITVGRSKLNSKDFEGALYDFNQVLVLSKNNPEAYRGIGLALYNLRRYNEALPAINKFLEINKVDTEMINTRILCYMGLNQFQNTIPDFDRLIRAEPNNPKHYQGRGLSYVKLGDRENALQDLIKAQSLGAPISQDLIESLQN